jgi:hypothetical protein
MKQKNIRRFMGRSQAAAIHCCLRGEEADYFRAKLRHLQEVVDNMPVTYETQEAGASAFARLHYFRGGCDAWIAELDAGAPDDAPEDYQSQAWGMVDLGYGPEIGYVSIPELLAAGMELDLYWKPQTLAEIRRARGG